jgi:hypothetical protein
VATGIRSSGVSTRSGSRGGFGAATVLMQDWPIGRGSRTERACGVSPQPKLRNPSCPTEVTPVDADLPPDTPLTIHTAGDQKNVAARHHPDLPQPRRHPAGRNHPYTPANRHDPIAATPRSPPRPLIRLHQAVLPRSQLRNIKSRHRRPVSTLAKGLNRSTRALWVGEKKTGTAQAPFCVVDHRRPDVPFAADFPG